jgi:hypothetical protein
MPLIRYRIEDVGVPSARTCAAAAASRHGTRGRVADYLKKPDGSMVAESHGRAYAHGHSGHRADADRSGLGHVALNLVRAPNSRRRPRRICWPVRTDVRTGGRTPHHVCRKIPQEASGNIVFDCRI